MKPLEAKHLYCFYNAETLQLFTALYPDKADSFVSLPTFIQNLGFTLPNEREHALAFQSLIPKNAPFTEQMAEEYYKTILLLRESLILKEEHLEHCFSLIPESQKNLSLKNTLKSYLQSALSHDLAQSVWQLIGEIREKKRTLPFSVSFVEEASGSFLFKELSEVASAHFTDCRAIKPWEVSPLIPNPKNALRIGSDSESLLGFSQSIREWKKVKSSNEILWIPFYSDTMELEYATLLLDQEGISYQSFFETKDAEPLSTFSQTLSNLRKNKEIPLKERLELNQALLNKKQGFEEELKEKLKTLGKEHLFDSLTTHVQPQAKPLTEKPEAILFPFQVVSPIKDVKIIGFCNSSYLNGETLTISFTESELELLYQGGFPLPRRSVLVAQRKESLNFAAHHENLIYTSLLKQNLSSDTPSQSIALLGSKETVPETYDVDLKINRLSATQLETYAQCPAKYFFLNRLRMRTPLSFKDSYALVLGQTVHLALENACKTKFPFTLEELHTYYAAALKEYLPEAEATASHQTILTSQFQLIAERVQNLENTLDTLFGPGTPILVEKAFELEIEGLKFTGKIDRVDLRDGKIVILDYKTGNVDFTPEHIRKGANFQALLYILAIEKELKEPLSGMLFYDLKLGELKRGILIEEEVSKEAKKAVTRGHTLALEKFETLMIDGIEQIKTLAKQMNSGDFAPQPASDKCGYCEAKWMCRKAYGYV